MLAFHDRRAACAEVAAPMPSVEITTGELPASLEIVTLPVKLPTEAGEKVTLRFADSPGAMTSPDEMPVAPNPVPEMATFEMSTLEFPLFVSVTARLLVAPE